MEQGKEKIPELTVDQIIKLLKLQRVITSFKALSIYTGFTVKQLENLHAKGKLPHAKPTGGQVVFPIALIDEWMDSNRVIPRNIEAEAINHPVMRGRTGKI